MKPLIISAILLCVTTSTAYAQDADVDVGALAWSARESLWSMSGPVESIVKPDGKGGVVNAGFGQKSNINIRIPSRRRPAKGRPNNVGSHMKVRSESFSNGDGASAKKPPPRRHAAKQRDVPVYGAKMPKTLHAAIRYTRA